MNTATQDAGWTNRSILILAQEATDRARIAEMAGLCRLTPITAGESGQWPLVDVVFADLRTNFDNGLLEPLAHYLHKRPVPVIAWTGIESIDNIYAAMTDGELHWLIDGSEHEALALLATLAHKPRNQAVHQRDKMAGFAELHRISDQLADFAHVLAIIAGQSAIPMPIAAPAPNRPVTTMPAAPVNAEHIRAIIRARRLRERYFPAGLFGDPAWDIVLDLMAAKLEGVNVSVSSLCIAAAVPPTTALRCITGMTANGLLERTPDPDDARRIFISLSGETEQAIRSYLASASGLAIL